MDNKKLIKIGIFLLLVAATITIAGTLTSYALPETTKSEIYVTKKDALFINYDNTSNIKLGSKAAISNTLKYQIGYTNISNEPANNIVTIHLSKGLTYIKNTSSLGEPTIKKDEKGNTLLIYKRTMLKGQTESGTFSCVINKEATKNIEVYMTLEGNDYKKDTPKLTNQIGDFTITYKSDGNGTVSEKEETVKYKNNLVGTLVTPDDGYKFLGWTSNSEVTLNDGKKVEAETLISNEDITKINVTKDITLTAIFESKNKNYTVTYKDGENIIIEPFKVEKNASHKLMNLPEKEGFKGKYWIVEGVNYLEGRTITINKDTIINASYEKVKTNIDKNYKIVYKTWDKNIKTEEVSQGEEIILKDIKLSDNCIIRNYKINEEEYKSGDTITVTSNLEIYASSLCALKNEKEVQNENANTNPTTSASINVNDNRFSSLEETNNVYRLIMYAVIGIAVIIDFYLFVGIIKKHKNSRK